MARDTAKPKVTGPVDPRPETVIVDAAPEPESEMDVALLGSKSLVTIKPDTPGDTMQVRILRACSKWAEGDTPTVHAEYGRQLVGNGLAEEMPQRRSPPKGKAATGG